MKNCTKITTNKLLFDGVINFFFKKEEYRRLSNFQECNIRIIDDEDVREYDSGECCFHGEKFIRVSKYSKDENRRKELLEYGMKFVCGICQKDANVVKKWVENIF